VKKYSADELFKIAYGHLQKKEFEKSTQLFERLLNDYPDNLSILRNLSHSYAFSGAFKKAEECIKKIIKINPKIIVTVDTKGFNFFSDLFYL